MTYFENLERVKKDLDAVSPSFCLAKWMQVTIHLQIGFNHCCHHPDLHKIPLDELAADPSALHNTSYKKKMREMMLAGERPAECAYCWKVEDSPKAHFSDRILKSADDWANPKMADVLNARADKNINPSYVEVSFGYECNFRCSYCNPYTSSSIWNQYEKYGPYVTRYSTKETAEMGRRPYLSGEANPYVDAFWKWFPDLSKDLRVFRVTGGEPLINPNLFKVLDFLDQNPRPQMQFWVNSNFGVPDRFFDQFLEKIDKLTKDKKVARFGMFTSVDTHGAQAEYLRVGLKYEKWLQNVRKYLARVPWDLSYMVTFNTLSPPRFTMLLEDLMEIDREFLAHDKGSVRKRTHIDISHLLHPECFSPWILPPPWRRKIGEIADFMTSNSQQAVGAHGFKEAETLKMKRIHSWVEAQDWQSPEAIQHRQIFYRFTNQFEEREKIKFLDVFPEMEEFYIQCKLLLGSDFALEGRK